MSVKNRVSGCNAGGIPITAWTVKFRVNDCSMRECVTADTEVEAEAVVVREYALLGLRVDIVDVCRQLRKDQFMQGAIRRNKEKWDMVQSHAG